MVTGEAEQHHSHMWWAAYGCGRGDSQHITTGMLRLGDAAAASVTV